jgi:hypothetical protein
VAHTRVPDDRFRVPFVRATMIRSPRLRSGRRAAPRTIAPIPQASPTPSTAKATSREPGSTSTVGMAGDRFRARSERAQHHLGAAVFIPCPQGLGYCKGDVWRRPARSASTILMRPMRSRALAA